MMNSEIFDRAKETKKVKHMVIGERTIPIGTCLHGRLLWRASAEGGLVGMH